jgi:uncharacterized membrane protein
MTTPASVKHHPIHLILVPIPIGLWIFALVADLAAGMTGLLDWRTVAFYCIGGGAVGALLAAVPGLVDLLSLADRHLRGIAITHMAINLVAVAAFVVNFLLRWNAPGHAGPLWLTLAGVALLGVSGWLGGELVHRHGVGVAAAGGSGAAARS